MRLYTVSKLNGVDVNASQHSDDSVHLLMKKIHIV